MREIHENGLLPRRPLFYSIEEKTSGFPKQVPFFGTNPLKIKCKAFITSIGGLYRRPQMRSTGCKWPEKTCSQVLTCAPGRINPDYGITNGFEIYRGAHTSAVAGCFENPVIPFFSQNLCLSAGCK
jgi:hypothetical protein